MKERMKLAAAELAMQIISSWSPGWYFSEEERAKCDLINLVLGNLYRARAGRRGAFGFTRSMAVLKSCGIEISFDLRTNASFLRDFLFLLDEAITVRIGDNLDQEYDYHDKAEAMLMASYGMDIPDRYTHW